MKIVYVVENYTNGAGMERVLATKANYFVEYGYEVSIISQIKPNREPFFFFDPRIKIICLNIVNEKKNKREYLQKLSEFLHEMKPDIAISTGTGLGTFSYEVMDGSKKIFEWHFSKYKGKPFLVDWDKNVFGRLITDIYKKKQIHTAKQFDRFVVLTEEDKESWRGISQIEAISNPLPYRAKEFSDNTHKRVIAVGRLTNQKAFHKLIRIWNDVYKGYPDWQLVIFGTGRKKKNLEGLVAELNLSSKTLQILPPTQNIEEEYAKSSIFAMTSRYEGQGLVMLEAMDARLATVTYAFRCGARDMLTDGVDGFIVEEDDSKAFAERLKLLMDDDQLRKQMGAKAHENVERYTEENIMPRWIQLFEKLVKE